MIGILFIKLLNKLGRTLSGHKQIISSVAAPPVIAVSCDLIGCYLAMEKDMMTTQPFLLPPSMSSRALGFPHPLRWRRVATRAGASWRQRTRNESNLRWCSIANSWDSRSWVELVARNRNRQLQRTNDMPILIENHAEYCVGIEFRWQ